MSVIVLAGRKWNHLERVASAPTPETADSRYPIANLANGLPWEPFRFGSAGGSGYIDFDLQQIPNGEGEAALVGGLPAAGWAKSSGATLVRDTTIKNGGAASIKLTASASGDGFWYDLQVRPGEWFNLHAAVRSHAFMGTTASVRVRNLATGQYLGTIGVGGAGPWYTAVTDFVNNTDTTWVTKQSTLHLYQVEGWDACRQDVVTLRVECRASSTPAGDIWFDDLVYTPEVDLVALLGHDAPPVCGYLQILSDATSPASTVRATLPINPTWGTSWVVVPEASRQHRYFRFAPQADPLERALTLGELVFAQRRALLSYPNQGRRLRLLDPRERQETPAGEFTATPRGARGRHELAFDLDLLRTATEDQRAELREVFQRSRGGAYPLLVIIDDTVTDGSGCMLVRSEDEVELSERSDALDRTQLRLKELPLLPVRTP